MLSPSEAAARRAELYELLGDLPPREGEIEAKLISEVVYDGYVTEELLLHLNEDEPVPAYFVRPKQASGPTPVIIYNHSHGGNYAMGKREILDGREYLYRPYALDLIRLGYSVLAIDAWGFGDRRGPTESELFKEMLWTGKVLWGQMMYDTLRAVDYVCGRSDVDPSRIATLGMSMGSTAAWWLAALDERVKVCVDICCLTDFASLIEARGLDGHGVYYYVPNLVKHFSTGQINELIAPRPHLSLAGKYDRLTPLNGLLRVDEYLDEVYRDFDAEDRWELSIHAVAHLETGVMRLRTLQFLEKWL